MSAKGAKLEFKKQEKIKELRDKKKSSSKYKTGEIVKESFDKVVYGRDKTEYGNMYKKGAAIGEKKYLFPINSKY